jgi:hypothetical protein
MIAFQNRMFGQFYRFVVQQLGPRGTIEKDKMLPCCCVCVMSSNSGYELRPTHLQWDVSPVFAWLSPEALARVAFLSPAVRSLPQGPSWPLQFAVLAPVLIQAARGGGACVRRYCAACALAVPCRPRSLDVRATNVRHHELRGVCSCFPLMWRLWCGVRHVFCAQCTMAPGPA